MFKNRSMQICIDFNMITSPICVSSQTQMQCHYEDKTNKNNTKFQIKWKKIQRTNEKQTKENKQTNAKQKQHEQTNKMEKILKCKNFTHIFRAEQHLLEKQQSPQAGVSESDASECTHARTTYAERVSSET